MTSTLNMELVDKLMSHVKTILCHAQLLPPKTNDSQTNNSLPFSIESCEAGNSHLIMHKKKKTSKFLSKALLAKRENL
jgi:hypothetical protein